MIGPCATTVTSRILTVKPTSQAHYSDFQVHHRHRGRQTHQCVWVEWFIVSSLSVCNTGQFTTARVTVPANLTHLRRFDKWLASDWQVSDDALTSFHHLSQTHGTWLATYISSKCPASSICPAYVQQLTVQHIFIGKWVMTQYKSFTKFEARPSVKRLAHDWQAICHAYVIAWENDKKSYMSCIVMHMSWPE